MLTSAEATRWHLRRARHTIHTDSTHPPKKHFAMITDNLPASIHSTSFDVQGLSIAALRSNPGARHRVLAVHGWLDNANSFIPLCALLPDVDLVAIDLPGHGHSAHLGPGAHYHFIDIMSWAHGVAEALKWQNFHYMGHSLGGCIAPFIAAAHPESVSSITMLEATGPITETPAQLPDRLKRSITDYMAFPKYKTRCFKSLEDATNARLQATTMSRSAAQLIVERQLKKTTGGYTWRYDQRHRSTSPIYQTEQQIHAVLEAVTCPALAVIAEQGYLTDREQTSPRLSLLQNLTRGTVAGHHHMHMDDPAPTAQYIQNFLAS